MKKVLLAAAIVLVAGTMASCNGEGCYKITTEYGNTTQVIYIYGDDDQIDAKIADLKAAAELIDQDVKCTKRKVNFSEEDCLNQNIK